MQTLLTRYKSADARYLSECNREHEYFSNAIDKLIARGLLSVLWHNILLLSVYMYILFFFIQINNFYSVSVVHIGETVAAI